MPGMPPPVADERAGLLAFLDQQRYVLKLAAHGLSDAQARVRPTPSALTVGGLLKHIAGVESGWVDTVEGVRGGGESDYVEGFTMGEDETLGGATAFPLMAAVEGWPETPRMKPWRQGAAG